MNRAAPLFPVLLAAMMLVLPANTEAASLKVSPSLFVIRDIEPGRAYDVHRDAGVRLTIYNDDASLRTWSLSLHRPSERGRWETGFAEIPNPEWCWFDEEEITVAPHDRGFAHLHLKVPDEERYYNQHWVVTASIAGGAGGKMIALAADVRILLETKPKTGLRESPDGTLGVEPSIVRFDDLRPGQASTSRVLLHNNDDAPHRYTVSSLLADPETRLGTYLTASFQALLHHEWIKHQETVSIGPRDTAVLDLKALVPKDPSSVEEQWEEILLIRPEEGAPRFIRVRMEMQAEAEE